MSIKRILYVLFALVFTLYACKDPEILAPDIKINESSLTFEATARYYTIKVDLKDYFDKGLKVTSDQDWCIIVNNIPDEDGNIEIFIEENKNIEDRTAVLTITSVLFSNTAECKILQYGLGRDGTNGGQYSKFRIGYGYNLFAEFNNSNSTTVQVIDLGKINQKDAFVRNMVQRNIRSQEKATCITATTKEEMARLMSKYAESEESSLFSSKKTIDRFASNTYEETSTNYCYFKLDRITASMSIDLAGIRYCKDNNIDIFTEDFNKARKSLIENYNNKDYIKSFLNKYGTHIVITTDLGGSMDLSFNFSRTMKGDLNIRAEDFSNFVINGQESGFMDINGHIQGEVTDVTRKGTFTVVGGSESAINGIKSDINNEEKISPKKQNEWKQSIDGNPFENENLMDRLAAVNFTLTNIWQFFPPNVATAIYDEVVAMSAQCNTKFNDKELSLDNYLFDISKENFTKFNDNNTLVRVIYASNNGPKIPVLEVCNEYVPVIRGDKRVTVIYAIKNGYTFHGAGLFPGDGDGNPPAFLTFSDSSVYVKPIDGLGPYDKIDKVFYIKGHIYANDLGLVASTPRNMIVEDQYLTIAHSDNQTVSYPIVKIGSGYWTRKNISRSMSWGTKHKSSGGFTIQETIDNNVLYTSINTNPKSTFNINNLRIGTMIGQDSVKIYNERSKWYVPYTSDMENLIAYIGYNAKSLFWGQASGMDITFDGYYGYGDIGTNANRTNKYIKRGENNSYFVFRNDKNNKGVCLEFTPDYVINKYKFVDTDNGRFPVRMFRTSYLKYKDK